MPAAGLVDEASLPTADVAAAVAAILADPAAGRAALQYGSTQGLPALREKVLNHVCAAAGVSPSDIGLSADDVILTTGSQQLLYLLGEALFDPGDIVLAEATSYFVYHGVLQSHGVRVVPVPMDDGGMDIAALDTLKRRGELGRVKLVYTVDYFQNPTGLTLAADRRPKLVEVVKKYSTAHRILILEDAAYRELRYSGPDLPSVKKFDPTNEFVAYASTFSKPLSPGLKLGYALLPSDLVAPILHLKGNHDFGSANLAQHVVARLMATGAFDRHVEVLRDVSRTVPGCALYVWLTLPPGVDAGAERPAGAGGAGGRGAVRTERVRPRRGRGGATAAERVPAEFRCGRPGPRARGDSAAAAGVPDAGARRRARDGGDVAHGGADGGENPLTRLLRSNSTIVTLLHLGLPVTTVSGPAKPHPFGGSDDDPSPRPSPPAARTAVGPRPAQCQPPPREHVLRRRGTGETGVELLRRGFEPPRRRLGGGQADRHRPVRRPDLVTGNGDATGLQVRVYFGTDLTSGKEIFTANSFNPFPDFRGGVFVG